MDWAPVLDFWLQNLLPWHELTIYLNSTSPVSHNPICSNRCGKKIPFPPLFPFPFPFLRQKLKYTPKTNPINSLIYFLSPSEPPSRSTNQPTSSTTSTPSPTPPKNKLKPPSAPSKLLRWWSRNRSRVWRSWLRIWRGGAWGWGCARGTLSMWWKAKGFVIFHHMFSSFFFPFIFLIDSLYPVSSWALQIFDLVVPSHIYCKLSFPARHSHPSWPASSDHPSRIRRGFYISPARGSWTMEDKDLSWYASLPFHPYYYLLFIDKTI